MNFYKTIKEDAISGAKVVLSLFIVLAISALINYDLPQSSLVDNEPSYFEVPVASAVEAPDSLVLGKSIGPELTLKSLGSRVLKVMNNYFGVSALAQSFDNGYLVTFKTKCSWILASINDGVQRNNYPNPTGPSIFYREDCQDPDGTGSLQPPLCSGGAGAISFDAFDAGVTCYPTGIDMTTQVNGRVLGGGAGYGGGGEGGGGGGSCFELPDNTIVCPDEGGGGGGGGGGGAGVDMDWYFLQMSQIVGVCERTCIWQGTTLL